MLRTNKLQSKILISVLGTLLAVFILLGLFIGKSKKQFAINKAKESTQLTAQNTSIKVNSIFNQNLAFVKASAKAFGTVLNTNNSEIRSVIEGQIASVLKSNPNIDAGWILITGNVLEEGAGSNWALLEMANGNSSLRLVPLSDSDASQLYSKVGESNIEAISELTNRTSERFVDIYAPIFKGASKVGFVGIRLNMNALTEVVNAVQNVKGGSVAILTNTGVYAAHTNAVLLGSQYAEAFAKRNSEFKITDNIAKGADFEVEADLNNEKNYAYYSSTQIANLNAQWSIEVNAPMSQLLAASRKSILYSSIVALIGLIIIYLVIYKITSGLIKPINNVTQILNLLSVGNLKDIKAIELDSSYEIKEMGNKINTVIDGLKKTEEFALQMGQGNLENDFKALSDDDQLGKALIDMRDSLKNNKEEDERRKEQDEQSAWATNGIAKFGEILRQDNDNMKDLGYSIMSNLVKYLNVNQGALFVLNEDNENDPLFELVTTIAFDRDKHMSKEIRIGEGLVGRCAFERKTVFLTDVPKDYHNIKSGLGDAQPDCILIVPCILNDEVYGIIELASFKPLKSHEIEFVEKLGESIGSTLSSTRINLKTASLLAASKNQGEELAAQEEELRQNLEEMEATQEDLKRQMQTNNEMRNEMSKQTALLDALLNSLPDYIYFKDKDSKFLRISKSMVSLFGATSVDEVIGKSDFDFQTPENAQKYYNDEQEIIQSQQGFTDLVQKEFMPDGRVIWNSVSKLPLMTVDGECIGTFGISKNITDIKNLELEAKKQTTLLDALLNSLPDYIYFKDKDSKFLRISKSMISLFGASKVEDVIGKSDFDFQTPENAQKYFDDEKRIMETGKGITNQLQKEQMPDGKLIWNSVTKLPLVTEEGDCIGTFGISKDVTELKNLEIDSNKQKGELVGVIEAIRNATLVIEYNKKGVVIDANQGLLDLLKLDKKNYLGTLNKDEITDMSENEHEAFWGRLLEGNTQSIKNSIKVGNKKISLFEAYSPVYDDNNKFVKVLRLAFDIS